VPVVIKSLLFPASTASDAQPRVKKGVQFAQLR
jgi:hypothetical protein